jgi:hypothetical protein
LAWWSSIGSFARYPPLLSKFPRMRQPPAISPVLASLGSRRLLCTAGYDQNFDFIRYQALD